MKKLKFNDNWNFSLGAGGALAALAGGEIIVENVTLPHDAAVKRPRNENEPNGSGNGFFREESYTYTKLFEIEKKYLDKNIYIEFEGVYQNAFVYVNGAFAGKHPYGYGNFYLDITTFVKTGENQVKVVVKNGVPSGRWYTGGGIYRDVNLMIVNRLHIDYDGVNISTVSLDDQSFAKLKVSTIVKYNGIGLKKVYIETKLLTQTGIL